MTDGKKIIAIIPARSGSKGLKNKNIKQLNGKPLLAYSIEAARKTGIIDKIVVSTDSEHYAEIAEAYGAEVPGLRSRENASDTASSWAVVEEVISQYEKLGQYFDICVLLQPTSPLRYAEDILGGIDLMLKKQAHSIIGMCEMEHSPLWANTLPEDGSLQNFISERVSDLPRQEIAPYYRINGALYIVNVDFIKKTHNLYQKGCYAYIMPKERSVDIDSIYDFYVAEAILRKCK